VAGVSFGLKDDDLMTDCGDNQTAMILVKHKGKDFFIEQ